MNAKMFMATTGRGIARATRDDEGAWHVEHLLPDDDVRCLATDPLHANVMYAGTQGEGMLRSDDAGRTWRVAGMEGHIVKSIGVSPLEPGLVYAGIKPANVFVSRDGGDSWTELDRFRRIPSRVTWFSPAEPPGTAYVMALALSPANPDVILAGIEFGGVVRSDDDGNTWTDHRKGALRDCHSMTFHVSNGDWVYEGGGTGAGASFSNDGGNTWTQSKKGLDRHYGFAVAADPERPEMWYASIAPGPGKAHSPGKAEAHIFRSEGGAAWQKLGGGLPDPITYMPYALLTDPSAPGHVYAGLGNGDIWHSADHGDNWAQLPLNVGGIRHTLVMQ